MPTPNKNFRIPKYLMDFIHEYKRVKKIDSSTQVLIYALNTLKRIYEEEKSKNPTFSSINVNEDLLTPEQKLMNKLENNFEFRKKEYNIVQSLSDEEQKDYLENYKALGMSLQEYYSAYIKGQK